MLPTNLFRDASDRLSVTIAGPSWQKEIGESPLSWPSRMVSSVELFPRSSMSVNQWNSYFIVSSKEARSGAKGWLAYYRSDLPWIRLRSHGSAPPRRGFRLGRFVARSHVTEPVYAHHYVRSDRGNVMSEVALRMLLDDRGFAIVDTSYRVTETGSLEYRRVIRS
jgi:hypothetical protein